MEELKRHRRIFSKLGFCYIAGTAAVYLLQVILSSLIMSVKPEWMENININLAVSCLTVYGAGMPLIVLLAGKIPVRRPERHTMKWWQFILALIMCYALMVVSNMAGLLITAIVGVIKGSEVQNNLIEVVTGGNLFLNFLLMVIVAPVVEEYVFRKVLVDRTLRYGQGVAVVMSGLMFGLFHGNLNQFAYAVVLGCFFAFIYVKTGNLKITIGMHAIINFMGSVVASKILELVHYDELLGLDTSDLEAVLEVVKGNPVGWMIYLGYLFVLFGVVLTGIILFIVFLCCRRFQLEPGEITIPKGQRVRTLIVNPGMLVFCIVWFVLIVMQLFA